MTEAVELTTPENARDFGRALSAVLRAGDLVILSGALGAGKTTLTQGIGAGLNVRGPVTSPTFVIARLHPSLVGGPPLVHVDAYRLGSLAELHDLDLDASIDESVTVVEWGAGLVDDLSESHIQLVLVADPATEIRHVALEMRGPRWAGRARASLLEALTSPGNAPPQGSGAGAS